MFGQPIKLKEFSLPQYFAHEINQVNTTLQDHEYESRTHVFHRKHAGEANLIKKEVQGLVLIIVWQIEYILIDKIRGQNI